MTPFRRLLAIPARLPMPARRRPLLETLEDRCVPATLLVNTLADDVTFDAFLTLREAISLVNAGGNANAALERSLSPQESAQISGTFGNNDTIAITASGAIQLADALPTLFAQFTTIQGLGPNATTISRADGLPDFRIFDVSGGATVTLEGLTIAGGRASRGGGVSNAGDLTLDRVILSNNVAQGFAGGDGEGGGGGAAGMGGAIYNAGTLRILDSTLFANRAVGGAGGAGFAGGTAGGGGGVLGSGGTGTAGDGGGGAPAANAFTPGGAGGFGGGGGGGGFFGSSFQPGGSGGPGGFGGGGGGGGGFSFASPSGSVFAGGTSGAPGTDGGGAGGGGGAGLGGAIFNADGTVILLNTTLSANVAQGGAGGAALGSGQPGSAGSGLGGAIFSRNGSIDATNVTIADNAAQAGGGIFAVGDDALAVVTLNDVIVANSVGGIVDYQPAMLGEGVVSSGGFNNLVRNNGGFNGNGTITGQDPLLAPLGNHGGPTPTHALLPGSPALDAGDSDLTLDQRGLPRPDGQTGLGDLGAVEAQGRPLDFASPFDDGSRFVVAGDPIPSLDVVALFDSAPLAGLPIRFTIIASDTDVSFSGQSSLTVNANSSGFATAALGGGTVPGSATIQATAPGSLSVTFVVVVSVGEVASYQIAPVGPVDPGAPIQLSVTPLDRFGNAFPSFPGEAGSVRVVFSSSDPNATLPGPLDLTYPFDPVTQTYSASIPVPGFALNTTGTFSITLTEQDGSPLSETIGVVVNNSAPQILPVSLPPQVRPNELFTLGGDFLDAGGSAQGHTVRVDWGDGTSSTQTLPPGVSSFSLTHTYGSGPPTVLPISVVVTDNLGASTTLGTSIGVAAGEVASYQIAQVAPVEVGATFALTVTPVDAFGNPFPTFPQGAGTLAVAFSSTDPLAILPGPFTFTAGIATFSIPGFALNSSGTRTITLTEQDGSPLSETIGVVVDNPAPQILPVSLPPQVRPNEQFTLGGDFTDAGGSGQSHTVSVDWGDGTFSTQTLPPGVSSFAFGHAYGSAQQSSLVVRVVVTDSLGASAFLDRSLFVTEVAAYRIEPVGLVGVGAPFALTVTPLDVFGNPIPNVPPGSELTIAFSSSDPLAILPGPFTFIAGGPTTVTIPGFALNTSGVQGVTLIQQDGSSISATVGVVVSDPPPVLSANPSVAAVGPNDPFTLSGHFIDPGNQAHLVTIFWGDGTSTQQLLPAGVVTFASQHAYGVALEGTIEVPILVVVEDTTGQKDQVETRVSVSNVGPRIVLSGDDPHGFTNVGSVFTTLFAVFDEDDVEITVDYGDGRVDQFRALPGLFSLRHVYQEDASVNVTIFVSDDEGGFDVAQFRVDVLLAGVEAKSRLPLIDPGEQLTVSASAPTELGTATIVGTLLRDPNGVGQATLIVAVVPRAVDLSLDASLASPDRLITAYDVRYVGPGGGDAARITFNYFNDDFDLPTVTFFDRRTRSQQPVFASQVIVDRVARSITLVFGPGSMPRLSELNGTVLTISVPFAVSATSMDGVRDTNIISTLNRSNSPSSGTSTQASGAAPATASMSLLSGRVNSSVLTTAAGGSDQENDNSGGAGTGETGPLRELPQPPGTLLALPSVTVTPATQESPGRSFDQPSESARVRGEAQPPEAQDEPDEEQTQPEESAPDLLDELFENLTGWDGATQTDASWAALAVAAFVASVPRRNKDEVPDSEFQLTR